MTMENIFSIAIRTIIGLFAVVVGVGAFLEGFYLTWIGGISLALLATVNPPNFKTKWNVSFWLVFSAWIILFLVFSAIDMKSGVSVSA
jgi:hypothetical protein